MRDVTHSSSDGGKAIIRSVEPGLRGLIRALVREELAALHGDAAHAELVPASPPCATTSNGEPPLDKAIYTAEEVARLLGCSPKAHPSKHLRHRLPEREEGMLAGEQVCAARGCFIGTPRPLVGR